MLDAVEEPRPNLFGEKPVSSSVYLAAAAAPPLAWLLRAPA
jgi:hypothetical protein